MERLCYVFVFIVMRFLDVGMDLCMVCLVGFKFVMGWGMYVVIFCF